MSRPFSFPQKLSTRQNRLYGRYEKLFTVNDLFAALYFLVGSIMFFRQSLADPATWCFTLGSIHFLLRPAIKVAREFHLARLPLPGDDSPG